MRAKNTTVRVPGRLTQRQLLSLASERNGTAVQYQAMYHGGRAIVDKSGSGSGRARRMIQDGDLVVQQDCATVAGTVHHAKFKFDSWKMPGVRNRNSGVYSSLRPVLGADCPSGSGGSSKGLLDRPRLAIDPCLSAGDVERVASFVRGSRAGETPIQFFESESRDDGEEKYGDNDGVVDDTRTVHGKEDEDEFEFASHHGGVEEKRGAGDERRRRRRAAPSGDGSAEQQTTAAEAEPPTAEEASRDEEEASLGDAGGGEFDIDRSSDGIRDDVEEGDDDQREVLADKSNAIDRPTHCEFPVDLYPSFGHHSRKTCSYYSFTLHPR